MKRSTGKEMRNLVLAVSISTTLLVIAIIAFYMVSIILTANDNIEHNKERMIEESVRSLQEMSENAAMLNIGADMISLFNQELIDRVFQGDKEYMYEVGVKIMLSFYPIEYVGFIHDGEIKSYGTRDDIAIDPEEMPAEPPEGNYEIVDSLGDRDGFFVSVFTPLELSMIGIEGQMYIDMIVDRTAESAEIEDYFIEQRNNLVLQMSIAAIIAIILTLLLTTLGLRYFTNKYVAKPIEELNRTAEEIADGTFDGELEVDEDSAYAALQGLLCSGQKVLQRMDEEMRE